MTAETATSRPLLVVIGLAFLVHVTLCRLRRIRIPTVVGEIVAGIVTVGTCTLCLSPRHYCRSGSHCLSGRSHASWRIVPFVGGF
jgi:Kef-type K+ transport system membrane component KefB